MMIIVLILLLVGSGALFFGLANSYGRNPFVFALVGVVTFIGPALVLDTVMNFIFQPVGNTGMLDEGVNNEEQQ